MKQTLTLCLMLSSAMFFNQNVTAAKVYQWTDADGVVHFSDVPPADSAVTATREILFDDFAENGSNQEKYSIIDQANVMAAWRRQLTEDRLAVKRLQLEEQHLAQELELSRLQAQQQVDEYYQPRPHYFVFPQPYFHNYHRRHVHEQPEPPPVAPRIRFMPPSESQAGMTPQLRVSTGL